MKKLLVVALPAGLAILAAALVLGAFRSRTETSEARLERARLKREFDERVAVARALPADRLAEWRDEIAALSRWYFEELAQIRNRHPGEEARPTGVAAARAERDVAKKDRDALRDWQEYADGRFALLKEARYAPLQSSSAEGLRLDLVAIDAARSPDGGPGLRLDVALWGAPRYLERERSGEKTTTRTVTPVSFRRLALRFVDANGKPYGEMSGSGEPYQKLTDPERWVDDFPPGVLFGTYWVELFPREAATVELELEAAVRGASGAERPAVFKASLPVPDGWKLPPGATFQAEVREAAPAPAR